MAPKPFRAGCVPGLVAEAEGLAYPLVSESRSDHIGVLAIDALPDEGRDLLLRYREGDALAFDLLMRLYRAPIYGFFRRSGASVELADDLFHTSARARARRPATPTARSASGSSPSRTT